MLQELVERFSPQKSISTKALGFPKSMPYPKTIGEMMTLSLENNYSAIELRIDHWNKNQEVTVMVNYKSEEKTPPLEIARLAEEFGGNHSFRMYALRPNRFIETTLFDIFISRKKAEENSYIHNLNSTLHKALKTLGVTYSSKQVASSQPHLDLSASSIATAYQLL